MDKVLIPKFIKKLQSDLQAFGDITVTQNDTNPNLLEVYTDFSVTRALIEYVEKHSCRLRHVAYHRINDRIVARFDIL